MVIDSWDCLPSRRVLRSEATQVIRELTENMFGSGGCWLVGSEEARTRPAPRPRDVF
jgi:hypothetical protein